MAWHKEPRRHELAAKGILTRPVLHRKKDITPRGATVKYCLLNQCPDVSEDLRDQGYHTEIEEIAPTAGVYAVFGFDPNMISEDDYQDFKGREILRAIIRTRVAVIQ